MSVVVIANGAPLFEVMEEARITARALETNLLIFTANDEHDANLAADLNIGEKDRIVRVTGLAPFSADAWRATFAELLAKETLDVVFLRDSAHARAFFPALALHLKKPLVSNVTRVRVVPGPYGRKRIEIERPLHAGLQTERLVVGMPLFLTLANTGNSSAIASAKSTSASRASSTTYAAASTTEARDRIVKTIPPNAETVDIRAADRIVAGGLGLGSKEAVAILPRLAKLLHAAVGGTRVISDRGWLEHERYIGSTGKTVSPKLYVALGISGASQHLVGITESQAIVAINTDRAAPIFGVADLGVVGDLHKIVPELEKRLAKGATK